MQAQAIICRVN